MLAYAIVVLLEQVVSLLTRLNTWQVAAASSSDQKQQKQGRYTMNNQYLTLAAEVNIILETITWTIKHWDLVKNFDELKKDLEAFMRIEKIDGSYRVFACVDDVLWAISTGRGDYLQGTLKALAYAIAQFNSRLVNDMMLALEARAEEV
jgi:hypothetical protein